MKCLFIILLLTISSVYGEFRNKALGFTDTSVPGYDAETNPNRTGIVSVSLNRNKAEFYLADPLENPVLPYDVLIGYEQHYCYLKNGEYDHQAFQYIGIAYMIDITLDADNNLFVYINDVLVDIHEGFCEVKE